MTAFDYGSKIAELKRDLNAVVLAHYYQDGEIQDVADFIGDSLALAQQAAKTRADVIVFCGVHFMAETAKILNPTKTVLLPDLNAGCSLSDRCPPGAFRAFRERYPDAFVVTYVNSSAEVKAMSDVICTSSNAAQVVARAPANRPILFAPDRHLGRWVQKQTGREMILWPGTCMVHEIFSEKLIVQLKVQHPRAVVVAHPECEEQVLRHADYIGSTKQLLEYAIASPATELIVVTEAGIIHQMERRAPHKRFIAAPPTNGCACNECPHMKLNTIEKLVRCMTQKSPQLVLPETLIERARRPLELMLEWS